MVETENLEVFLLFKWTKVASKCSLICKIIIRNEIFCQFLSPFVSFFTWTLERINDSKISYILRCDIWDLRFERCGEIFEKTSKVDKDIFVYCVEWIEWGCLDTTHISTL